jgi:hypothetical protein
MVLACAHEVLSGVALPAATGPVVVSLKLQAL